MEPGQVQLTYRFTCIIWQLPLVQEETEETVRQRDWVMIEGSEQLLLTETAFSTSVECFCLLLNCTLKNNKASVEVKSRETERARIGGCRIYIDMYYNMM
mmetsp:Transcript_37031/g.80613  ORF Transcript_37031/g.80613 Transcript_37031/m.80613 type:complete len:100 (+) Transcript_37031:130-429(+)